MLIFNTLYSNAFVKSHLKTALKLFRNVKSFSVFFLSLLTPANIAKISRISARLLRLNYFYVSPRV